MPKRPSLPSRSATALLLLLPVSSLVLAVGCQLPGGTTAPPPTAGDPSKSPVRLVEGLGPVHHPVSTANPEAQKFFDQGLAYLYAFNHAEAERSFARAGEIDPKLAMAQWGRAIVLGPNYNVPEIDVDAAKAAYAAARQAVALAPGNATPAEQAYINAVAKRYPVDPKGDWHAHAVEYKNAMAELTRRQPDDLDGATLYAESMMNLRPWRLYTKEGKPEEGTDELVRVLEWVLARNPNHVGANHYYIHAVEASTTPERALPSAQRLPTLCPAAGHLVHMPAHVFVRMGDYNNAILANANAAKVDENYISCCAPSKMAFYPAMYYSHNLHFLTFATAMAGRSKESADAAARLSAHIEPGAHHAAMLDGFAAMPIFIAVRQGQWREVSNWPKPKDDRLATLAAWQFARGMSRAALKDVGPALEAQEAFRAAAAKAKDVPMGNNMGEGVYKVAGHLLTGKIAALRGDNAAAKRELELAVAAQDELAYDEPPAFPWPVRENLGAFLLTSGDAAAAEKVFREDLVKTPNNPRSLFGLAQSLKARGQLTEAAEVQKKFDAAWSGADIKLTIEDL